MSTRKLATGLVVLVLLACWASLPALAESHARIVRLSDVQGTVMIDRNTGDGFEKAFLNMPVIEGMVLETKDGGRAEIEFEDGSVIRIAPDTKLAFSELSLRDSGVRVSTIKVDQGLAYVNFGGHKDDQFTINFGQESLRLAKDTHFRVEVNQKDATLAVFKGEVPVTGASGSFEVGKKQSATFDLSNNDSYTLAKNIEEDPYDSWDREQADYHQRYRASKSYNDYPYSYGVSDLNYYGNYFSVPGYGMVWQPYFAGAGWNPFMDGAWVWYPGFGYTWVSSYPWGWMPYRYGNWAFASGYGWFWQPGGWNNWYSVPRVVNPPNRFRPPQAPPNRTSTVVSVGRGPVTGAPMGPPRRVTISRDSAGFGLTRGSVNDLRKVSRRVENDGAVTVKTTPPARTTLPASTATGASAAQTSSAPSRTSTGSSAGSGNPRGRVSQPSVRMPSSGGGSRSSPPSRSTPPHR
jgi:hypothetical protein